MKVKQLEDDGCSKNRLNAAGRECGTGKLWLATMGSGSTIREERGFSEPYNQAADAE
jgi:hypothetical protein